MKKVVWTLFAVLLIAAIPHPALGQARTTTPLTKLTGVYKAAKAVQVNIASDEMTAKTLSALIESLKLELALAADAVTTRPERDGLAAYERARLASDQAMRAQARLEAFLKEHTADMLRLDKFNADLRRRSDLGSTTTPPSVQAEKGYEGLKQELKQKADQACAGATISLNAAHALYLRKGVVRKVVPR